jgi:hypothetical protein
MRRSTVAAADWRLSIRNGRPPANHVQCRNTLFGKTASLASSSMYVFAPSSESVSNFRPSARHDCASPVAFTATCIVSWPRAVPHPPTLFKYPLFWSSLCEPAYSCSLLLLLHWHPTTTTGAEPRLCLLALHRPFATLRLTHSRAAIAFACLEA